MKKLDKNKTVLDYVIDQVSHCKLINKIIIATTNEKEDDEIIEYAKNYGLLYFRGSKTDVLDRYYQCAKSFSISSIVRITSDCPLIDPNIIDDIVNSLLSSGFDYCTNKLPMDHPKCAQGTEVEAFSIETLEKIWMESKKLFEREHVTPYIYNNPQKFKIFNSSKNSLPFLRYTIDREKDLELVRTIVSKIVNRPILSSDIEFLYKQNPKLFDLNSEYYRNEGYLKSIKEHEI